MSIVFKEKGTRDKIDLKGLRQIYTRLFAATVDGLTKADLDYAIKAYGRCECDDLKCKAPLRSDCEYDHKYPDSLKTKGDAPDWLWPNAKMRQKIKMGYVLERGLPEEHISAYDKQLTNDREWDREISGVAA